MKLSKKMIAFTILFLTIIGTPFVILAVLLLLVNLGLLSEKMDIKLAFPLVVVPLIIFIPTNAYIMSTILRRLKLME